MKVSGTKVSAPRKTATNKTMETTAGQRETRGEQVATHNEVIPTKKRISWANQANLQEQTARRISEQQGPELSWAKQVEDEESDRDVLDLNPERPTPEPETQKPIQRGTIPGEWEVPEKFELATTAIELVKAKLHDRPKHTQRRFKLRNEKQEACWVKIGRAGDVRISAWFQTKSIGDAPLGKEGGV
ncbi:uncharacterized protein LOC117192214 [Drosophila miranda]|nr:uncharacterized protein LOC117186603 [Drosophila miranda]XP_033251238.1 uncharacterized protein LOC117190273 [Drosophila miranda]XP_033252773.1 uncharacterized protein LOC117192214 [Drosophila miranda]XP_033252774.1 uncharacterized protein LOC117192214 [Drosophila miranda]